MSLLKYFLISAVVFSFLVSPQLVQAGDTTTINIEDALVSRDVEMDLGTIVSAGISAAIVLGMIAVILYLIRAGYLWISSGGDKAQLEQARSMIINALIGITLLASVFAIFTVIDNFFGTGLIESSNTTPVAREPTDCTTQECLCGGVVCNQYCFANGACSGI